MRRRRHQPRLVAAAVAAAAMFAQAPGAYAQKISPLPPPEPIGKHPPEHTREWYLQNGYHWDGHDWVIKLAERPEPQPKTDAPSAPADVQSPAEPQPAR